MNGHQGPLYICIQKSSRAHCSGDQSPCQYSKVAPTLVAIHEQILEMSCPRARFSKFLSLSLSSLWAHQPSWKFSRALLHAIAAQRKEKQFAERVNIHKPRLSRYSKARKESIHDANEIFDRSRENFPVRPFQQYFISSLHSSP